MMGMNWIALVMCLVLVMLLVFKELIRANKFWMWWRIMASIVAVISLYLMLFPIHYQVQKNKVTNALVFLSPGTERDSIASLPGIKYVSDPILFEKLKSGNSIFIPDLLYFLKTHPEINKINLYGYGFSQAELRQLSEYEIAYHPPSNPSGILSISWSGKIKSTEKLLVQGNYYNQSSKTVMLVLQGLGLRLDSLKIEPKVTTHFSFENQPRQSGKAVYHLLALQGKDTLAREPVPFETVESTPMKVLILASYPEFEYKFLKNWLYENHYPVIFRSQISKGKYSMDFLNTEKMQFTEMINSVFLKKIDLLITDEETRETLSAVESAAINKEVKMGMGILVRPKLQMDTYTWLLAGRTAEYSSFWSDLMRKKARKKDSNFQWEVRPKFPLVLQKMRVVVDQTAGAEIPKFKDGKKTYAPRQNMELPFQWEVSIWPENSGWTPININNQVQSFYVYEQRDWKSIRNLETIKGTKQFTVERFKKKQVEKSGESQEKQLPRGWIFIVFLFSAGFLWYESRFLRNKFN